MMVPETEVGKLAVEWLMGRGFDVFEEVNPPASLNRIDIVARQGKIIIAVECKANFNNIVAEQASRWLGHANYVFVCAPQPKHRNRPGESVLRYYCRDMGIGVMLADMKYGNGIDLEIDARLNRRRTDYLSRALDRLTPNTGNAGCKINEESDWKRTCKRWARYVALHPGCTLKEVMEKEGHHYFTDSTAKSSMAKWINAGRVTGIEARREGRRLKLYPQ